MEPREQPSPRPKPAPRPERGITTIPLTKTTRDRLRSAGRKGESYDALINRLLDRSDGVVEFEEVR